MLKWIFALKAKDGVDRDAMLDHWENRHAPNAVEFYQPEQYTITFFDPLDDGGTGFTGMASLWFRNLEHFTEKIGPGKPLASAVDGFGEFIDRDSSKSLLTTERVGADGDVKSTDTKLTYFVTRLPHVSQETLFKHWVEIHLPNLASAVRRTPHAQRNVISIADQGGENSYDGIGEYWFRDPTMSPGDLQGREDDGIGNLISAVAVRGREIVIAR